MSGATNFDVIVIASSMGGVSALGQIVANLPIDLQAAVMIVQHLSTSVESDLVDLLSRLTQLPVKWSRNGDCLQPGTIYVAAARSKIEIRRNGLLSVEVCSKNLLGTPAADPLFKSIADYFGTRAIAVVLTGALWDGAAGIEALKQHGGTVLIQDPQTALAKGMPEAAIDTVGLHFVLPLNRIALALTTLTAVPAVVSVLPQRRCPLRLWLRYTDNSYE